jgi:DNA-binding NtrC family response regulator
MEVSSMLANRVLLVEDDNDTREITALLLDHAGYEVIVAPDLASGIAISREQPDITVVMADMYLDCGQTGISLIRTLRDNGLHMPIVLTSAHNEASIAARDLNVAFLPKPYGRQALLSVMALASAGTLEPNLPQASEASSFASDGYRHCTQTPLRDQLDMPGAPDEAMNRNPTLTGVIQ